MNPRFTVPNEQMRTLKNCILHAAYLSVYGVFKYSSFPLINYVRFVILYLFSWGRIQSISISDGVMIWFPWKTRIKKNVSLNQGVIIDGFGGVEIEEGVRIAPYVCINTADHGFDNPNRFIMHQDYTIGRVTIEKDVWIGAGAIINKGVTIGANSIIGSGAVVTKDIPQKSIAAGIPARVIQIRT
ncbi:MAG: acyltransferase [Elusimicrobia bacterium]|nr:acyltransferase [Elusimicrobiota bacterium]